jgi:hypothetical protein
MKNELRKYLVIQLIGRLIPPIRRFIVFGCMGQRWQTTAVSFPGQK